MSFYHRFWTQPCSGRRLERNLFRKLTLTQWTDSPPASIDTSVHLDDESFRPRANRLAGLSVCLLISLLDCVLASLPSTMLLTLQLSICVVVCNGV